MRCTKCHKRNMDKANYCKKCGYAFTEEEKKYANKHNTVNKLEKVKNIYEKVTFKFITESIYFQIFTVLVVLALGIYMVLTKGTKISVIESDQYHVIYNSQANEYYVLLDNDALSRVTLNLFLPNRIKGLNVKYYDENDQLITEEEYETKDEIITNVNSETNDYYVISDISDAKEKIKLLVYYSDDVKKEDGNDAKK